MNLKRRQSRYERPIYAFWELFSDYSAYSTIHGVRYMGEKVNPYPWPLAFFLYTKMFIDVIQSGLLQCCFRSQSKFSAKCLN